MMKINSILFTVIFIGIQIFTVAQQDEKIRFSGLTRSFFSRDVNKIDLDTTSTKNFSSGYNLIDLNTHINPIKEIEVFAQLRISNQFGSFFGSGTNIIVRQLTAKGVLGNRIKFTIGDMYLKQNKFTLHNYDEELPFLIVILFLVTVILFIMRIFLWTTDGDFKEFKQTFLMNLTGL